MIVKLCLSVAVCTVSIRGTPLFIFLLYKVFPSSVLRRNSACLIARLGHLSAFSYSLLIFFSKKGKTLILSYFSSTLFSSVDLSPPEVCMVREKGLSISFIDRSYKRENPPPILPQNGQKPSG
jgi:hypothetical protein